MPYHLDMELGDLDACGQTLQQSDGPSQSDDSGRAKLSTDSDVPYRIGRFTILEEIGSGAMGRVYAGYDNQLDRKVAIKVLRGGFMGDRTPQRLLREAQALARVSHPNVVTIHEIGEHEGQLFLAMQYVRGQTLDDWLHTQASAAPWYLIVEMLVSAGKGLAAVHQVGLIHRDFKPQNVLVGEDGLARVVDFGLARLAELKRVPLDPTSQDTGETVRESSDALASQDPATLDTIASSSAPAQPVNKLGLELSLTGAGAIMGTPNYMACEQFYGHDANVKSDQFSFCVTLFEALEGRRPFTGSTIQELLDAVSRGPSDNLRTGEYPVWLANIIARGLAPTPEQRWPSMDALLTAIEDRRLARDNTEQRLQLRKILLTLALGPPVFWFALAAFDDPENLQAVDTLYLWIILAVAIAKRGDGPSAP